MDSPSPSIEAKDKELEVFLARRRISPACWRPANGASKAFKGQCRVLESSYARNRRNAAAVDLDHRSRVPFGRVFPDRPPSFVCVHFLRAGLSSGEGHQEPPARMGFASAESAAGFCGAAISPT